MAYPETGVFRPPGAYYREPGDELGAARAEGLKKGSYLASMDQFYAQMDRLEEQFEKEMSWAEESLGLQLASRERLFMEDLGFKREQLEQGEEQSSDQFRVDLRRSCRLLVSEKPDCCHNRRKNCQPDDPCIEAWDDARDRS